MNDSHIEGERIPKRWKTAALSQISTINPKLEKPPNPELEVSFIPMRNVEQLSGKVNLTNTKTFAEVKNRFTYFEDQDIIFAKITPCMQNGKIAIVDKLENGIGYGSTEFHVIRLLNLGFSRKFYFYYLIQESFRKYMMSKMKGTAGQLRVPTDVLSNAVVPIPPLAEQKRIVAKIESIFSRIDVAREKLEVLALRAGSSSGSLSMLRDSILEQAFGGKLVPQDPSDESAEMLLKRINPNFKKSNLRESRQGDLPNGWTSSILRNVTSEVSKINPKEMPSKLYYYCDIESINNSTLTIAKPKQIFGKDAPSRARQLIKKSDILFSTVRTYLKNIAIVPNYLNDQLASTGFCVIRSKINNRFVFYYVQSKHFLNLLTNIQRGTSYPAIRNNDVLSSWIFIPPLAEQKRIVAKIESIFGRIDAKQKEMQILEMRLKSIPDSIDALRNSILKQAFEGKLVQQDPNDEPASILLKKIKSQKSYSAGKKSLQT